MKYVRQPGLATTHVVLFDDMSKAVALPLIDSCNDDDDNGNVDDGNDDDGNDDDGNDDDDDSFFMLVQSLLMVLSLNPIHGHY